MPIEFTIDHKTRFVHAKASGVIRRTDLEEYLDQILIQGAMPYRKLWDCGKCEYRYDDNDMMLIGARVSAYAEVKRGPTAVVATTRETIDASMRFFNLGGGGSSRTDGKIFRTEREARAWLAQQPAPE
ncbi:MAG TPA: hypothetical protein VMI56_20660 [Reyranella sp.]|nr:hypothetical protein [Reyranella sp.]